MFRKVLSKKSLKVTVNRQDVNAPVEEIQCVSVKPFLLMIPSRQYSVTKKISVPWKKANPIQRQKVKKLK